MFYRSSLCVANQKELYQWAYDQARKESDQKLFWDWSI